MSGLVLINILDSKALLSPFSACHINKIQQRQKKNINLIAQKQICSMLERKQKTVHTRHSPTNNHATNQYSEDANPKTMFHTSSHSYFPTMAEMNQDDIIQANNCGSGQEVSEKPMLLKEGLKAKYDREKGSHLGRVSQNSQNRTKTLVENSNKQMVLTSSHVKGCLSNNSHLLVLPPTDLLSDECSKDNDSISGLNGAPSLRSMRTTDHQQGSQQYYKYWKAKAHQYLEENFRLREENQKLKSELQGNKQISILGKSLNCPNTSTLNPQLLQGEALSKKGIVSLNGESNAVLSQTINSGSGEPFIRSQASTPFNRLESMFKGKFKDLELQIKQKNVRISQLEDKILELNKKLTCEEGREKLIQKLGDQIHALSEENMKLKSGTRTPSNDHERRREHETAVRCQEFDQLRRIKELNRRKEGLSREKRL